MSGSFGVGAWATTPLLAAGALIVGLQPRLRRDSIERLAWQVAPASVGSTWIHASSVGEIRAATALFSELSGPILLTADTDTGLAQARRVAGQDSRIVASALPLDHPFTLAPLWAEALPRAVVFVESVFWPGLASMARAAGVPVIRVSAKAGRRHRTNADNAVGRAIWRRWFRSDLVIARDEVEAQFFRAMGDVNVEVGGDLKLDAPVDPSPLRWPRPFVVAGSTREGDEASLIGNWRGPEAVLLAPRHPARWGEVARLLDRKRWVRRSALKGGEVPEEADFVLLDSIGELAACWQGARAGFIGGTFDPRIGGHSPIEAMQARVPICAGPYRHANLAAFDQALGVAVATPAAIVDGLRAAMNRTAPRVTGGTAARTARRIQDTLREGPAPEASPRPWALPLVRPWTAIAEALRGSDSLRLPVLVVAVGSTNARGPGKTSTVRAFAEQLRMRGHVVGVVVRGYRRAAGGRNVAVSDAVETIEQRAYFLGDEGALIAGDGFLVAASPDRVAAAKALVERGVTAIVLDDALQHCGVACDLEIAVVDARFPGARGLIPAGERRERDAWPSRVDGVVVHHGWFDPPLSGPLFVRAIREFGEWHLGDRVCDPPAKPRVALAGIGRPADFRNSIEGGIEAFWSLPDHAPVSLALADDLRRWADGRPLLTTAKDRVRLPRSIRDSVWWRDVRVRLVGAPESWFQDTNREK